jgi:hypothetical protein
MKNGRGKETDLSKAVIGYSTQFLERSTGLTHLQRLAQWIDGFLFVFTSTRTRNKFVRSYHHIFVYLLMYISNRYISIAAIF